MIHINHLNAAYGKRCLFHDAEITIERGKLTAVCGPSGVGKTTLLNIIGLISGFYDYTYTFDEKVLNTKNEQMKADMRKTKIAYVFQEHNLHDDLSLIDNMKLYCTISAHEFHQEQAEATLKSMGLTMDIHTKVSVLSGGEYQRLSLACALMKNPDLIIADEVTSALDHQNSEHIIDMLKEIAQSGRMVILATHNKEILSKCDVVYTMANQKIIKENMNSTLDAAQVSETNNKLINPINLRSSMRIFYRWYSKFSLGKRKWEKRMFILMPSIIIFICLFFIGIKDGMIQHFHDSLNEYGMNEVYITGDYDISDSSLDSLKKIEGVSAAVSFTPLKFDSVQIDHKRIDLTQSITVVPYYSFQNSYLDKEGVKGAYLSYYLAERYGLHKGTELQIKEGNVDIKVEIGGILEQDKQLVQGMSTLYVIYIPQSLYPSLSTDHAILHLDSFEFLYDITNDINEILPNHHAYLAQSDYLTQMESMEKYSQYLETFISVLFILTVLFLSVSQYFAVKNHKYEICVLRANGLSKKEVSHVILRVFINDMLKTGGFVFILLLVTRLITLMFGSELFVYSGFMTMAYLFMVVGTYLLPVLLTLWIMLRINIEKMMRS